MHKTRYGRLIMALMAGLLMALAIGGTTALADEWGSGSKTVTAHVSEELRADLAAEGSEAVLVDAYRIATATRSSEGVTYDYQLVAPFDTAALNKALSSGDWEALAKGAANVVIDSSASGSYPTVRSGKLDEAITLAAGGDEGDGIWLLLPHGESKGATSLKASSKQYEYTFSPCVVALPTKDATDGSGKLNSAVGNWVPDAIVYIKAERESTTEPTKPTPSTPATPASKPFVRTGDDTDLFPFYVAMGVSGVLLVVLSVQWLRERRKNA